eukprot:c17558_g1_i2.p1 GENE.c17558_g1_i2~~c17558_g1_i2.p1  ORF type:complete len:1370 (+),score=153.61 c17558_g1_i2:583-4692(+)
MQFLAKLKLSGGPSPSHHASSNVGDRREETDIIFQRVARMLNVPEPRSRKTVTLQRMEVLQSVAYRLAQQLRQQDLEQKIRYFEFWRRRAQQISHLKRAELANVIEQRRKTSEARLNTMLVDAKSRALQIQVLTFSNRQLGIAFRVWRDSCRVTNAEFAALAQINRALELEVGYLNKQSASWRNLAENLQSNIRDTTGQLTVERGRLTSINHHVLTRVITNMAYQWNLRMHFARWRLQTRVFTTLEHRQNQMIHYLSRMADRRRFKKLQHTFLHWNRHAIQKSTQALVVQLKDARGREQEAKKAQALKVMERWVRVSRVTLFSSFTKWRAFAWSTGQVTFERDLMLSGLQDLEKMINVEQMTTLLRKVIDSRRSVLTGWAFNALRRNAREAVVAERERKIHQGELQEIEKRLERIHVNSYDFERSYLVASLLKRKRIRWMHRAFVIWNVRTCWQTPTKSADHRGLQEHRKTRTSKPPSRNSSKDRVTDDEDEYFNSARGLVMLSPRLAAQETLERCIRFMFQSLAVHHVFHTYQLRRLLESLGIRMSEGELKYWCQEREFLTDDEFSNLIRSKHPVLNEEEVVRTIANLQGPANPTTKAAGLIVQWMQRNRFSYFVHYFHKWRANALPEVVFRRTKSVINMDDGLGYDVAALGQRLGALDKHSDSKLARMVWMPSYSSNKSRGADSNTDEDVGVEGPTHRSEWNGHNDMFHRSGSGHVADDPGWTGPLDWERDSVREWDHYDLRAAVSTPNVMNETSLPLTFQAAHPALPQSQSYSSRWTPNEEKAAIGKPIPENQAKRRPSKSNLPALDSTTQVFFDEFETMFESAAQEVLQNANPISMASWLTHLNRVFESGGDPGGGLDWIDNNPRVLSLTCSILKKSYPSSLVSMATRTLSKAYDSDARIRRKFVKSGLPSLLLLLIIEFEEPAVQREACALSTKILRSKEMSRDVIPEGYKMVLSEAKLAGDPTTVELLDKLAKTLLDVFPEGFVGSTGSDSEPKIPQNPLHNGHQHEPNTNTSPESPVAQLRQEVDEESRIFESFQMLSGGHPNCAITTAQFKRFLTVEGLKLTPLQKNMLLAGGTVEWNRFAQTIGFKKRVTTSALRDKELSRSSAGSISHKNSLRSSSSQPKLQRSQSLSRQSLSNRPTSSHSRSRSQSSVSLHRSQSFSKQPLPSRGRGLTHSMTAPSIRTVGKPLQSRQSVQHIRQPLTRQVLPRARSLPRASSVLSRRLSLTKQPAARPQAMSRGRSTPVARPSVVRSKSVERNALRPQLNGLQPTSIPVRQELSQTGLKRKSSTTILQPRRVASATKTSGTILPKKPSIVRVKSSVERKSFVSALPKAKPVPQTKLNARPDSLGGKMRTLTPSRSKF